MKKLPILVDPLPIAVVIPAHNAERFLKDALESIRGQTVRPAEIILVDDGSIEGIPVPDVDGRWRRSWSRVRRAAGLARVPGSSVRRS